MKDRMELARGWLTKGDHDLITAKHLLRLSGPYDTACFHCQQAAEKYLKAILAYSGQPILRTHDLREIHLVCMKIEPEFTLSNINVSDLTPFGVELRYDIEFNPDLNTTSDAVLLAERIRGEVAKVLPAAIMPNAIFEI